MHPTPAPSVTLPDETVDDLCRLLSTVEDWLLHTSDDVLADLSEFLGRNPHPLIGDLGDTTVMLRRWERS
jgi:hypothetical protein